MWPRHAGLSSKADEQKQENLKILTQSFANLYVHIKPLRILLNCRLGLGRGQDTPNQLLSEANATTAGPFWAANSSRFWESQGLKDVKMPIRKGTETVERNELVGIQGFCFLKWIQAGGVALYPEWLSPKWLWVSVSLKRFSKAYSQFNRQFHRSVSLENEV